MNQLQHVQAVCPMYVTGTEVTAAAYQCRTKDKAAKNSFNKDFGLQPDPKTCLVTQHKVLLELEAAVSVTADDDSIVALCV